VVKQLEVLKAQARLETRNVSRPVAIGLAAAAAVAFAQIHADQIVAAGGIAAKRQQPHNVFEKPAHHLFQPGQLHAQVAYTLNSISPLSRKIRPTNPRRVCLWCDKIAKCRAKMAQNGTILACRRPQNGHSPRVTSTGDFWLLRDALEWQR